MIDTRALLRMDVLDLAARLPRVFEFYLEGLRILLPRSWVSRGWRIKRELLTVGENGAVQDRLIVERSALGLTRVTNGPGASEPGPAFLLLPRERYFLTQLSLPAAARSSLKETVRLRIAEVSPISPEEVLVAVGPAKTVGARLHVDIALARKRVIEQLREACSGFSILGVGAAPKTDGDAEFIFEERAPARLDAKSVFLSGPALLAFALLALFISFDIHIARRASFMRAREAAVVEELHAARASAALFEGLPSEAERRGSARLPDIAQQTRATLENLPSGALIERVRFSNGIVTVNGFAPHIDAMPQTARGSIARSPSDRPDYDRIEYSLDRDEARESSE